MEELRSEAVKRLLDVLRVRADPMSARRFACACVRRIWRQVQSQRYVTAEALEQCRRAVELTERSLAGPVPEEELRAIDFRGLCDNGDGAFIAAAHVGWNVFAPPNGLDEIDEFENARATAAVAACVRGPAEVRWQVAMLRKLTADPPDGANC